MAVDNELGAHVEFRSHEYLAEHSITDLSSVETWSVTKGQLTDEASIGCQRFNRLDQLLVLTGSCFDIDIVTEQSHESFEKHQNQCFHQGNRPFD